MKRINLVPPPPLASRIKGVGVPLAVVALGAVVVALAVSVLGLRRDVALLMAQRSRLQAQTAQREALAAREANLKKEVEGLRSRERSLAQEVDSLMKSRRLVPPYSNLLLFISRTLPSSAKIDELHVKGAAGSLSGVITDMARMSPFVEELAGAPMVRGARLVLLEAVDKKHHLYRFRVDFQLSRL